jgi:hypothetical protein
MEAFGLSRRLVAEALGTAFLVGYRAATMLSRSSATPSPPAPSWW